MRKHLKVKSGLFIPSDILERVKMNGERVELEITESDIWLHPIRKSVKKTFTLESPLWDCVGFAEARGVSGRNHDRYIYGEKK